MGWVLRLAETGPDAAAESIDLIEIHRSSGLGDIANLGLTLAEAKQIMARLQQVVVSAQADDHAALRPDCCSCGPMSCQGLAASSGGDAVGYGSGAAPAISLCRLWS